MVGNVLIDALTSASLAEPDRVFAHLPDGQTVSFAEFFAGGRRIARCLVAQGLKPGDRVAVQVNKSLEALQLYVGAVIAGGVFLPLNPAYTAPEVAYFLNDAEPHVFICDPARLAELGEAAKNVPAKLTLNADGNGSLIDSLGEDDFDPIARGDDDLAAILYTSGTTGRSKGAMLSHRALTANALTLKDVWRFTSGDVLIHALPIFHTHGLFVATNTALVSGAAIIFQHGFDADAIVAAMPTATCLMGVPTFYTRLLDHPKLTPDATKNMRLFISGSAPLLSDTHTQWQARTGHAILERYGMTETNMNTSNPYEGERRAGTVGFPLPDVELKICDPENGQQLPDGEIGILEVHGPNVFSGYWNMPEKTAEELREDGFFITGDLGLVDADGYVSIVGRSKDLVISGGFNVYPKEVESLIDDIEGVRESAVIGVPHKDFGEAVVAVVVRSGEVTAETIKTTLSACLAKYKQPKHIAFIDELPRNTMGKVQKNGLRETYAGLLT